jgi:hypothetical protein
MTRRKKTDGERIAQRMAENWALAGEHVPATAMVIDRLVRRRMAEAWEDGWFSRDCQEADWDRNPYRGGRRKK